MKNTKYSITVEDSVTFVGINLICELIFLLTILTKDSLNVIISQYFNIDLSFLHFSRNIPFILLLLASFSIFYIYKNTRKCISYPLAILIYFLFFIFLIVLTQSELKNNKTVVTNVDSVLINKGKNVEQEQQDQKKQTEDIINNLK